MIANYHTHTPRCHHASGSEEEYVLMAIARGLKTLGFADHAPMPFTDGHYSNYRMQLDQFSDYIETLLALREKYRKQINILIGLEAEYYPVVFSRMLDFIKPYPVDYLILGQHFLGNEDEGENPCSKPTEEETRLVRYVDQVIEGLHTGCFSCLAHPDLLHYVHNDQIYRREAVRLCLAAKEMGVPLELNLLGLVFGRHYPRDNFWQIAAECGNDVILGCDAHEVVRTANPAELERGMAIVEKHGLRLLQEMPLRAVH